MTIRRGSLYAGAFVLAVGAVALASETGVLDRGGAADALPVLLPIAVIAVGVALMVRHTPASLPAGVVAATAPGLLLGGALVAAPSFHVPCTGVASAAGPAAQTQQGTIDRDGSVELRLACGDLRLTTQPGNGWRFDTNDGDAGHTSIATGPTGFTATSDGSSQGWSSHRGVTWTATLPTSPSLDLTTQVDAGRARLDLGGATLRRLDLGVDAGDLRADLAGATLDQLALEVNAGSAAIALPAHGFTGDIAVNAGSARVCVPAGLALTVHATSSLGSVHFVGLVRNGDTWVAPGSTPAATATPTASASPIPSASSASPASSSATSASASTAAPTSSPTPSATTNGSPATADLTVNASVGSVTITSQGGCQ